MVNGKAGFPRCLDECEAGITCLPHRRLDLISVQLANGCKPRIAIAAKECGVGTPSRDHVEDRRYHCLRYPHQVRTCRERAAAWVIVSTSHTHPDRGAGLSSRTPPRRGLAR